jgi:hypothetical protein
MVASSWGELSRQYQAQIETDLGTAIAVGHSQTDEQALRPRLAATMPVDADFITALNQGGAVANF